MSSGMRQARPLQERAQNSQVIETQQKVEDYARLVEVISADLQGLPEGVSPKAWRREPVDITLRFDWADERPGIPVVEGRIRTRIAAICQRCLEPFQLAIDTSLRLLLPPPGVSIADLHGYETWEFDSEAVTPGEIVEEALIIAMPLAAMHDSAVDCTALADATVMERDETRRPFKDLRALMAGETDTH
jgi:uncharacterized metal-binding protein YceD (DUF177 family)